MRRKFILRYAVATLLITLLGWCIITMYVQMIGPAKKWIIGRKTYQQKALIIFDPDPFYNLDEQVCMAFGKALASDGVAVTIATVAAAESLEPTTYSVIVYCANTYNWRPDWSIKRYIERHPLTPNGPPVVAITLGAGSTESSRKHFEKMITNAGGTLIKSYSLWLWRPNDQTKKDSNVNVAVTTAHRWGKQISCTIN